MALSASFLSSLKADAVAAAAAAGVWKTAYIQWQLNPSADNKAAMTNAGESFGASIVTLGVDLTEIENSPLGKTFAGISGLTTLVTGYVGMEADWHDLQGQLQSNNVSVNTLGSLVGDAGQTAFGGIWLSAFASEFIIGAPEEAATAAAIAAVKTAAANGGAVAGIIQYAATNFSTIHFPPQWLEQLKSALNPASVNNDSTTDIVVTMNPTFTFSNGQSTGQYSLISNVIGSSLDVGSGTFLIIRDNTGHVTNVIEFDNTAHISSDSSGNIIYTNDSGAVATVNGYDGSVTQTINGLTTSIGSGATLSLRSASQSILGSGVNSNGVSSLAQNGYDLTGPPSQSVINEANTLMGLGNVVGSSLGSALAGKSVVEGVVYSTLLGTFGEELGRVIAANGNVSTAIASSWNDALGSVGENLEENFSLSAVGTGSSYLFMELANALGVKGFGADLVSTVGTSLLQTVVQNSFNYGANGLFHGFSLTSSGDAFGTGDAFNPGGAASLLANAVGAFLGSKLASLVYSPQTEAGEALASIGSAVGAFGALEAGTAWATSLGGTLNIWGNLLFPGVGAFVGFILGALIGDLFGHEKPRIPAASAQAILQLPYADYEVENVSSSNGGDANFVTTMARTASDTLNGILVQVAGNPMPALVANTSSPTQVYGYTGNQIWIKEGGTGASQINVGTADQAVDMGVLWALPQTHLIGGNIFLKRAILNSTATSVTSLLGDLQIASDFSFYQNNTAIINEYISQAYNSLTTQQQSFYANNKAIADQIISNGLSSLSASERSTYNNDPSDFTKIASALQAQSLANPWIITLERASELGLSKWDSSDFYGGLGGFLSSFDLGAMSFGVHYEDITINWDGTNLGISLPNALGLGVFSILPQANNTSAGSMILNPRFQDGLSGWASATNQNAGIDRGVDLPGWSGDGNDVFYEHIPGATGSGEVIDTRSGKMAATAGATYEASVLAAQHRGEASVYLEFYNASGQAIQATFLNGQGSSFGSSGGVTSTYNEIDGYAVAPVGTVSTDFVLRVMSDGENDPYGFFTQPMERKVNNGLDAIINPRFEYNASGWYAETNQSAGMDTGVNLSGWSGSGNDVYYEHIPGVASSGEIIDTRTPFMAAIAGTTYEASVLAAQHRGVSQIIIEFYNSSGAGISGTLLSGQGTDYGSSNGATSNYTQIGGFATAPSGTAYSDIVLRIAGNGGTDPYGFFTRPIFRAISAGQTTLTNWDNLGTVPTDLTWGSDGSAITIDNFASQFGYTSLTPGAAPSGNTFESASGSSQSFSVTDTSSGNNIFIGGNGGNSITAGSGYDWIQGGAGTDALTGSSGFDTIIAGKGNTTIIGGSGGGYFAGGAGSTTIYAGSGAATLVQGTGTTTMVGGAGNDTFVLMSGNNNSYWVDGSSGSNTISFERYTAAILFNLDSSPAGVSGAPNAIAYGHGYFQNIQNVIGTPYDDIIGSGPNGGVIEGGGGGDWIIGEAGVTTASYAHSAAGVYVDLADGSQIINGTTFTGTAYGGDAEGDFFSNVQNLIGSAYNDELKGRNGSVLNGGAGDDTLDYSGGNTQFIGGGGFDTVDYSAMGSFNGTNGIFIDPSNRYGAGEAPWSGDTYTGISKFIGTQYADFFYGTNDGQTFDGGGGNDTINGGTGSDTYIFNENYGIETINDTNSATNVLQFGAGISFDDLYIAASGGSSGYLDFGIRGQSGYAQINGDTGAYPSSGNDVVKTLDMDGAGQVDIGQITFATGGSDNAETISTSANNYNLIFAYGGNDTILASNGQVSDDGSVIDAGLGNDYIVSSNGDDQYLFDRGDGQDTITDSGGKNTVVFGPTVAADDVIYQIVGDDLYIGIRSLTDPNQTASQVSDNMRFVGAGDLYENVDDGVNTQNTVDYVIAGGTTVNLQSLNLPWTVVITHNPGVGGPGGGPIPPIVLDLYGDGLQLSSVATSDIVAETTSGIVTRMGWVGPDDGILAVDRSGDGQINTTADISFIQDKAGAKTDLQGLAGWDTNGDGLLSSLDANWDKLLVWVDKNQDGVAEADEVQTLAQAGVTSISLTATPTGFDGSDTIDSYVTNTTTFTRTDGTTGAAYDVTLAERFLSASGIGDAADVTWDQVTGSQTIGHLLNDPMTQLWGLLTAASSKSAVTATSATVALAKIGEAVGGSMITETALSNLADVDFSPGQTISAQDATLWSDFLDPTKNAALKATIAAGMSGSDLLSLIQTTTAFPLGTDELTGRGVAQAAVRNTDPIVVDLTGAGLSLTEVSNSTVKIDADHTGAPQPIGWVSATDGILAYDLNGDGKVDPTSEISFETAKTAAKTSIQGLSGYDTNGDGIISAADSSYSKFLIWRDANQNGFSDPGETETLQQAGIKSISLTATNTEPANLDVTSNEVIGQLTVTMADGTTRTASDTLLGIDDPAAASSTTASTTPVTSTPSSAVQTLADNLTSAASAPTAISPTPTSTVSTTLNGLSSGAGTNVAASRMGEDGPEGQASQPVATTASISDASGWWANGGTPASVFDAVAPMTLAGSSQSLGAQGGGMIAASQDAASAQRQLLLRQSLVAFQGSASGSAAIWARQTDPQAASALSASTLPTAIRAASIPIAA